MGEKLIIHVGDNVDESTALVYVGQVIRGGRISGDSYCYHTAWESGIHVSSRRNKASGTFWVSRPVGEGC